MMTLTIPTWTLGDRLAKARRIAGYKSQAKFGAILGKSGKQIGRYELGETITYDLILRWAEVTGVSASWLLTGNAPTAEVTTRELDEWLPVLSFA